MANFKISVERPPGKGAAVVKVVLPNGHEFEREFDRSHDAAHFAEGIRQGFMLALNAIGFVPAVDHRIGLAAV